MRVTVGRETCICLATSSWLRPKKSDSRMASISSMVITLCSKDRRGIPWGLKKVTPGSIFTHRHFLGLAIARDSFAAVSLFLKTNPPYVKE
jgi:hypothetical protein